MKYVVHVSVGSQDNQTTRCQKLRICNSYREMVLRQMRAAEEYDAKLTAVCCLHAFASTRRHDPHIFTVTAVVTPLLQEVPLPSVSDYLSLFPSSSSQSLTPSPYHPSLLSCDFTPSLFRVPHPSHLSDKSGGKIR
jgi:hypothetical protein